MQAIIQNKQQAIKQLCIKYHVKKLEVFGSAVRDDFNPQNSDIDFLVEFTNKGIADYANSFFGLQTGLQNLFNTHIELVISSIIKNPYFLESIEQDRTYLYAA